MIVAFDFTSPSNCHSFPSVAIFLPHQILHHFDNYLKHFLLVVTSNAFLLLVVFIMDNTWLRISWRHVLNSETKRRVENTKVLYG